MSKIRNGGLDQYGAKPFKQQQFETAGVEGGTVCSTSIVYNVIKQVVDDLRLSFPKYSHRLAFCSACRCYPKVLSQLVKLSDLALVEGHALKLSSRQSLPPMPASRRICTSTWQLSLTAMEKMLSWLPPWLMGSACHNRLINFIS